MFRRFALSIIPPLAALVTLGTAEASTPSDVSVDVSYAGLDLSTPAGADAFRSKVNQAINEICGWTDSRDLVGMRHAHECRTAVASKVEPQIVARIDAAQDRLAAATAANGGAQHQ
jgi:UrcA family protein